MGNMLIKHKKIKLPSKKTMNLYQIEVTDNSWQRVIPYAILIIVIVFVFTKFGVFQRISQLNTLNEQVSEAQSQLDKFNNSLVDYDDVKSEYIRYTNDYMLEEEGKLVDRTRIIGLIGDYVSNIGEI
jgi:cell division protein FtsL